jgi:hypothetical protein
MSSGSPGILLIVLLMAVTLSAACTSPPQGINPPRGLIEEYVLAYNEGDTDLIYAMLLLFDGADVHPRYTDKEEVEKDIQEWRVDKGFKIVEYFILDEYIVENYAVITFRVIWEDPNGKQIDETQDVGFLYQDGKWKMVNLILPGDGG